MTKTMIVKIKRKFTSPLTGRRVKIDEKFNVPKNQFWLKRLKLKDCEHIKSKEELKIEADKKAYAKKVEKEREDKLKSKVSVRNNSKGSK